MKKKLWITAVAGACTGIFFAAAGSTMSYYRDSSHVENQLSFVGEDGIDAVLTEPSWDEEKALDVVPNEIIPKDPQVTNTSSIDLDIMAALCVQFVYGADYPDVSQIGKVLSEADMASVYDVYRINWNADETDGQKWIRFDGESAEYPVQHFYYSEILERNYPAAGDTTIPLFTSVSVPGDVNNRRYEKIQKIGGFDIKISGIVVQQMNGEQEFGINSPQEAYEAGLFK